MNTCGFGLFLFSCFLAAVSIFCRKMASFYPKVRPKVRPKILIRTLLFWSSVLVQECLCGNDKDNKKEKGKCLPGRSTHQGPAQVVSNF